VANVVVRFLPRNEHRSGGGKYYLYSITAAEAASPGRVVDLPALGRAVVRFPVPHLAVVRFPDLRPAAARKIPVPASAAVCGICADASRTNAPNSPEAAAAWQPRSSHRRNRTPTPVAGRSSRPAAATRFAAAVAVHIPLAAAAHPRNRAAVRTPRPEAGHIGQGDSSSSHPA
jgi:hypothetical protein